MALAHGVVSDARARRRPRGAAVLAGLVGALAALFLLPLALSAGGGAAGAVARGRLLGTGADDGPSTEPRGPAEAGEEPPSPIRACGCDCDRNATVLLGIFSTLTESEGKRRRLIRETYLRADGRFCPMEEYLRRRSDEEGCARACECSAPYAFVLGANPSGPADHDEWEKEAPLTVDRSAVEELLGGAGGGEAGGPIEEDAVYLNIRENMNHGKSPTWLKFASSLAASGGDAPAVVDYVAKLDSDALLRPAPFFDSFLSSLPPAPYNARTFGPVSRWRPGDPPKSQMKRFAPANLALWNGAGDGTALSGGQFFASGQFYLLSADLASYVSRLGARRRAEMRTSRRGRGWRETEDVDVAVWVESSPRPVRWVLAPGGKGGDGAGAAWEHPVKEDSDWRERWEEVMREERGSGGGTGHANNSGGGYGFCGFWKTIGLLGQ